MAKYIAGLKTQKFIIWHTPITFQVSVGLGSQSPLVALKYDKGPEKTLSAP